MGESQSIIVQWECLFLMEMLRIQRMLWNGHLLHCSQGAAPRAPLQHQQGCQLRQMRRLNALLLPGKAPAPPTSLGSLSSESARISRAKETRRSVTSPWQVSALEAAIHVCTAAPCSLLGRAGVERTSGLLKQMCSYCLPECGGNGQEKRAE